MYLQTYKTDCDPCYQGNTASLLGAETETEMLL